MRGYDTVVKQMRDVCRLMCKRESRQRLIATCYDSTGPIGKVMGESLAGFDAHVHTERWGTVAYAAINLMRVRDSLHWGWNAEFCCPGFDPSSEDQNNEYSVKIPVVDSAIRSSFFWGYVSMLQNVARVLYTVLLWGDGCACHWKLLRGLHMHEWDVTDVPHKVRSMWQSCVMRGRRLPELAAGDLFGELAELFIQRGAKLLSLLPADLSDQERLSILTDFERSRSHLAFTFTLKFSHWQSSPWCIFALAHYDPNKAATREAFSSRPTRSQPSQGNSDR